MRRITSLLKNEKFQVGIVSTFIFASYLLVLFSYHQQDEWYAFGLQILKSQFSYIHNLIGAFGPDIGHYVPLHYVTLYTLYKVFGINYFPYALISVVAHVAVSIALYKVVKLLQGRSTALAVMILFGVSASIYQGAAWPMANYNTPIASLFGLISIFYFLKKDLRKTIIFLIIGLLYKEIIIGLLPFFIIITFLSSKNKDRGVFLKKFSIFLTVYVILRGVMLLIPHDTSVNYSGVSNFQSLLINFLTFPLHTFTQILIPQQILIPFFLVLPSLLTEIVQFIILIAFVSVAIFSKKITSVKKTVFACFLFVFLNSLIYALSPGQSGLIAFSDSRNLYFPAAGVFLMLVIMLRELLNNKIFYLVLIIIVLVNSSYLYKKLNALEIDAIERKNILASIDSDFSKKLPKIVVLTESSQSYYGLSGDVKTLPFQSGFGQTLLVWLNEKEHFPSDFFKGDFLWPIGAEGYKEVGDRGFGYFRDFEKLRIAVATYNIDLNSVFAYSYNSGVKKLTNISEQIRGRLKGINEPKTLLSQSLFTITSSENPSDAYKMNDIRTDTFWKSKNPHNNNQFIDITLKESKEIAEIVIDSGKSKDQNAVGYTISVSEDKKNWKELFSEKLYPPDIDGLTKIFIEPIKSKFIRIEQAGSSVSANWIVNEISLYARKD